MSVCVILTSPQSLQQMSKHFSSQQSIQLQPLSSSSQHQKQQLHQPLHNSRQSNLSHIHVPLGYEYGCGQQYLCMQGTHFNDSYESKYHLRILKTYTSQQKSLQTSHIVSVPPLSCACCCWWSCCLCSSSW